MKEIRIREVTFLVTGPDAPAVKDFWVSVNAKNWEYETYRIFDEFLNKECSYVDIGAWVGPTVLYGAQRAKHCYAIEPDPVAFEILVQNIHLNHSLKNRITLFNGCIGDVSGDVKLGTMTEFGDGMSSIIFGQTKDYLLVKSLTLDEFMAKNDVRDCDFIKMDIEGGEVSVLPTAKAYLQKNMPTLFLSLHPFWFKDRAKDSKRIIEALKIYRNLYGVDGRRLSLDQLSHSLMSMEPRNFSVIATNNWSYHRRLLYLINGHLDRITRVVNYLKEDPAALIHKIRVFLLNFGKF